ncbi:MFS transporter [Streptomyces sp. NBC_01477]|uniref:MFS transporter n=1 Tax=Streptomyces sp. NBC_01477 TaxID=2976015 RepID=UPI002E362559|nr:MFS transporter [Streptomyces sp. NBC_01477]
MAAQSADSPARPDPGAAGPEKNPKRWWVLAVICVAQLMVVLDATVMNLALPSAQEALDFSNADRQWVVTAYALSFGSLLLFCGRLADLIGHKITFLVGVVGFAGASAIGGASVNFTMLVTARAGQGVFAALLAPAALALLATTFTDPKERGRAFGAYGGVAASGAGLGLIIGGALTSGLSWRWCMYVNLVFAAFAVIGAALPMGGKKARTLGARLDIPGVIAVSSGMFCLVYGFSNAGTHSWHATSTWGFLAAAVVLLVLFAIWQTRAERPLLPPRIVLDRNRGGAYLTMLVLGSGMFGLFLFLIYYMQTTLGYSAIKSGTALLPMVLATIVGSGVGNVVVMPKYGPRWLACTGLALGAGGTAWLTRIGTDSPYAGALLGPTMVIGLGIGLTFASTLQTATARVAPQEAGIASAGLQVGQQLGGAIGTALLNTIAATAVTDYLDDHAKGKPTPALLKLAAVHGYSTAFWWCTGIFAFGVVFCTALLRSGPVSAPEGGAPAPSPRAEAARA